MSEVRSAVARFYLNSYAPLVATTVGLRACGDFGLPPFIDGSIRREPDLAHSHPTISCLCRGGMFAPRLRGGDVVAYMTKKGRYGSSARHRRLTAVLRVAQLFESHRHAADWFRSAGLVLPSNCMVGGNPPNPVSRSHRSNEHRHLADAEFTHKWDQGYRIRARQYPRFVVCEPLWTDLEWTAPIVHDEDLKVVFGHVPATRNPGELSISCLEPLLRRLRVPAPPSAP